MLAAINERISKTMYTEFNFFATLQGAKLPSFESLSGLDSSEKLDDKTSNILEARALENLKKKQAEYELGKHKRIINQD